MQEINKYSVVFVYFIKLQICPINLAHKSVEGRAVRVVCFSPREAILSETTRQSLPQSFVLRSTLQPRHTWNTERATSKGIKVSEVFPPDFPFKTELSLSEINPDT